MNYIKIFHNAHALSISVGNSYSEDQLMHTFLDNFHQNGKYSARISSHQAELRREEEFTDQKSLNTLSLQTDYLNLDSRSGFGRNSERANTVQKKCTFCGGLNNSVEKIQKDQTGKGKRSCSWCFGKQTNRTDTSKILQIWI